MEDIILPKTKEQIIVELYNKMLARKVAKAIRDKDLDFLKTNNPLNKLNDIMASELIKNDLPKASTKQQICWITISKLNSSTTEDFIKSIHKLKDLRLTKEQPKYCFESTAYDGEEYKNIHCHYLCLKQVGINKLNYVRRLEKTLKDTAYNVNVMTYPQDYYQDKIDYMTGLKDADQHDKPEITADFRKKYNLNDVY